MQVISNNVYEVSNYNGAMLVLLSGSDEFLPMLNQMATCLALITIWMNSVVEA